MMQPSGDTSVDTRASSSGSTDSSVSSLGCMTIGGLDPQLYVEDEVAGLCEADLVPEEPQPALWKSGCVAGCAWYYEVHTG